MTAKALRAVSVFAPAKINLTLHITGQRADGYHLLDSLVAFGTMGDWVTIGGGAGVSLAIEGREAEAISAGPDNLVLRAAHLLKVENTAMRLQKNLPVAAGLGGGSADAAAAYRGILMRDNGLTQEFLTSDDEALRGHANALLGLGADVPMCLLSKPARVTGIGEEIAFVDLPRVWAVLINPRLPVSTPDVFKLLSKKDNFPMPETIPPFPDADSLIAWLATMRNDLEAPATAYCPAIADVLETLRTEKGCALARMSGSGATCFGLFETEQSAKDAAAHLFETRPDWWIAGGYLGDQSRAAAPRFS